MSFQFGANAGQPTTQPASSFSFTQPRQQNKSFGFGTTPTGSGFNFGTPATTASTNDCFGTPSASTGSTGFNFGAQNAASAANTGFSFGNTARATTTSEFSFGMHAASTASTGLMFGNQTTATAASSEFGFDQPAASTTTTGFAFGTPINIQQSSGLTFGEITAMEFGFGITVSAPGTTTEMSQTRPLDDIFNSTVDNPAINANALPEKKNLSCESKLKLKDDWDDLVLGELGSCYKKFCEENRKINSDVEFAFCKVLNSLEDIQDLLDHNPVYEEDYAQAKAQLLHNYKNMKLKMSECQLINQYNSLKESCWKLLTSWIPFKSVTSQVKSEEKMKNKDD